MINPEDFAIDMDDRLHELTSALHKVGRLVDAVELNPKHKQKIDAIYYELSGNCSALRTSVMSALGYI